MFYDIQRQEGPLLIEELDWDAWNEEHVGRHLVSRDEVEEVCLADHWAIRVGQGKYLVYGPTDRGRYLVVVVVSRSHYRFYPVTARGMTDAERRRYRQRRVGR